jgi:hypothetical protein
MTDTARLRELAGKAIPDDNDGIEQDAFEEWAAKERFSMEQHPLHWLFLDRETSAARRGWRGALQHANKRILSLLAELDASKARIAEVEGAKPEGREWPGDDLDQLRGVLETIEYVAHNDIKADGMKSIWGGNGIDVFYTTSVLGTYTVKHDGDEPEEWSYSLGNRMLGSARDDREAKVLAQEHHDKRILSAIAPLPTETLNDHDLDQGDGNR